MDSADPMAYHAAYVTPNAVLQETAAPGLAAETITWPFSVSLPGPPGVSVISVSFAR